MVTGENVGVPGGVVGIGGVELLDVVDGAVDEVVGERIGEKVVSLKGAGAGAAHFSSGAVIVEGGGGVVLLLGVVVGVVKAIVEVEVNDDKGVETEMESGIYAAAAHIVVVVGVAGVEVKVF